MPSLCISCQLVADWVTYTWFAFLYPGTKYFIAYNSRIIYFQHAIAIVACHRYPVLVSKSPIGGTGICPAHARHAVAWLNTLTLSATQFYVQYILSSLLQATMSGRGQETVPAAVERTIKQPMNKELRRSLERTKSTTQSSLTRTAPALLKDRFRNFQRLWNSATGRGLGESWNGLLWNINM